MTTPQPIPAKLYIFRCVNMAKKVRQRVGTTRTTKRYRRKRMAQPSSFRKGSFRTIRIGKGKKAIIGKSKRTGKMRLQSVLTPRKKSRK